MGIINEYHEPTTFNGVERPVIDNKISPSTWREIGFGISGNLNEIYSKYQLYLVNGLSGYETAGVFSGSKTLRDGRLKGSKAYVTSPALSGKYEFYGISNLTVGLSGYFGKSNSKLLQNMDKNDQAAVAKADSSMVGIAMFGADARFQTKGFKFTGQFYYTGLSNTEAYNKFTAKGNLPNDLGSAMLGYYAEVGYNVFQTVESIKTELMPFVRYEAYNTHLAVAGNTIKNKAYNNTVITTGLTCTLIKGAVLKADLQFIKSKADAEFTKAFNAGVGVMF
ncbi:MAG TPA: hypothetical protein DCQ31_00570 [Bacteroidales bacterium]|nr:hypothetical protein [Bacteroidales bacterium]